MKLKNEKLPLIDMPFTLAELEIIIENMIRARLHHSMEGVISPNLENQIGRFTDAREELEDRMRS